MNYNKITEQIAVSIKNACNQIIYSEKENLINYSQDESYIKGIIPELVAFPETEEEISDILKIADENLIPVTPRGGGTSVTGASIPVYGGIVISFEKMNRILDIDRINKCAVIQPGVILQDFQNAVENEGLFYPPDPNSLDSCTIGGNVSTNAGGPRCLKYGVTRNYVYSVSGVFPDGTVSKFGGKFEKISTGYNLAHLTVGSEGTLNVISELVMKLVCKPAFFSEFLVPFSELDKAVNAVAELTEKNNNISICEFIDSHAVDYSERFLEKKIAFSDRSEAYLIIRIDSSSQEELDRELELIGEYLLENGAHDVLIADDEKARNKIWEMRRHLRDALKHIGKEKIGEDIVVPVSKISEMIKNARKIGLNHGVKVVCYGHTGDGNAHINIVKDEMENSAWNAVKEKAVYDLFSEAVKLGGTISGEHGIGLSKKKYLSMCMNPKQIDIMRKIKQVYDPNNILNPGKIF